MWTAHTNAGGYGRFALRIGSPRRSVLAHRWSWENHYGPIADGLFVCHRCDVPACVNPAHLFLGTPADNMRDAAEKGRMPRGENQGNARLTERDVVGIRQMREAGAIQREIGAKYGVSQSAISLILNGKLWPHTHGSH
jgi:hypothetical protein